MTGDTALLPTPDADPTLMIEPGLVVPHEIHTDHVVAGGWDPTSLVLTADSSVEPPAEAGVTEGTVGIENQARFPHPLYAGIDAGLSDVDSVESLIVEAQRHAKTPVEMEIMREAAGFADRGHEIVADELEDYTGRTEFDVVHVAESALIGETRRTPARGAPCLNSGLPFEHARYYHGRAIERLTEGTAFTRDLPSTTWLLPRHVQDTGPG